MTYKDIHNYDDIINIPRPKSKKYPPMSMQDRAAQFAPFAALTGHKEAVYEKGRLTEQRKLLDNNQIDIINHQLALLQQDIHHQPQVSITYFVKDSKKSGGHYLIYTGHLKKIDAYSHCLIFTDSTKIPINDIYSINRD